MKRFLGILLLLAMALFTFGGMAISATSAKKASVAAKPVTGEIVDLGCYLDYAKKGAGHKECAATCIANGGPMGLLTSTGKLYVLTMNHDNGDAFNQAKKHAGDKVKITGPVAMRNGTHALQVNSVEAM